MARLACNTIVVIQTRAFREAGCNAHSLYVTSMHVQLATLQSSTTSNRVLT